MLIFSMACADDQLSLQQLLKATPLQWASEKVWGLLSKFLSKLHKVDNLLLKLLA